MLGVLSQTANPSRIQVIVTFLFPVLELTLELMIFLVAAQLFGIPPLC